MNDFNKAGERLLATNGEEAKLVQCDASGRLLVSSETTPTQVTVLGVITINPNPTSTYTPPTGAKTLIINAAPTNTAAVKYGTSAHGRRLYLRAGDTIQVPATVLSFESVTGTQEIGVLAYG